MGRRGKLSLGPVTVLWGKISRRIPPPPPVGTHGEFLVYGDCENEDCDFYMAAPEGSMWPLCPCCRGQVFPEHKPGDEQKRTGYIALRLEEQEAIRVHQACRREEVLDRQEEVTAALNAKPYSESVFDGE